MKNFAVEKKCAGRRENFAFSTLSNGLIDSLEGPKFSSTLELGGGGTGPLCHPSGYAPEIVKSSLSSHSVIEHKRVCVRSTCVCSQNVTSDVH